MTNDIDHSLLASYFAAECTIEESAAVEAWVRASPEHLKVLEECRALWASIPRREPRWDIERALGAVHEKLDSPPRLALATERAAAGLSPWWRGAGRRIQLSWVGVAAAMLVTIGGGAALLVRRERPMSEHVAQVPLREITTAKGQRTSLRLADGTRVSLGADSRLSFAPVFGGTGRDVYLDGEAFFEVTHDPRRPFRVHAGNSVTRVLGTKFGVRAYRSDPGARVVVVEGKVLLRPEQVEESQGVVLGRNDIGHLVAGGEATVQAKGDANAYLAWMHGRIRFRDASLRDVVQDLEHWYDVDFAISDSLIDSLRISVTFEHESLDAVTHILARTLDLHVERTGSAVVLSRRIRSGS